MTTDQRRPFLDVKEAETAIDIGALKAALMEAAVDAEKLDLPAVKEHITAALAHVAERADDGSEA